MVHLEACFLVFSMDALDAIQDKKEDLTNVYVCTGSNLQFYKSEYHVQLDANYTQPSTHVFLVQR